MVFGALHRTCIARLLPLDLEFQESKADFTLK